MAFFLASRVPSIRKTMLTSNILVPGGFFTLIFSRRWSEKTKKNRNTHILYLGNRWSQKLLRPLILIRKCMFLLVFHTLYIAQMIRNAENAKKWSKWPKKLENTQTLYLGNRWPQKLFRPLILIRKCMFLIVFHTLCTAQMIRNA